MTATLPSTQLPAPPRRAYGAMLVALLYTAILFGAPLLLRYGPEPEVTTAVARVAVDKGATPRCTSAPEFGRACMHVDEGL